MDTWAYVVLVVGFAATVAGIFGLQRSIDKLQRQVEHLHTVMLKELERL